MVAPRVAAARFSKREFVPAFAVEKLLDHSQNATAKPSGNQHLYRVLNLRPLRTRWKQYRALAQLSNRRHTNELESLDSSPACR